MESGDVVVRFHAKELILETFGMPENPVYAKSKVGRAAAVGPA